MSTWRRIAGAAMITAVLAVAPQARAAQPGFLVTGDNLPTNLDPHQVFDVPMQLYSLNTYDNLYRYEGNPPQLKPPVSGLVIQKPAGCFLPIPQAPLRVARSSMMRPSS